MTVRDIALKAGVHFTTVSRALSRHPSIPLQTCKRIRKIADKMGYVPDPMLSALNAYRVQQQAPTYHGNIAWVTNAATRDGWATLSETFRIYQVGARLRANELGYNLEEFWLREPGLTWKRSSDILAARNIRGLILPPQPHAKERVKLDWPRFAAVTFGFTLAWPILHTVSNNTFLSMQRAVRQARTLGYRRIGYVSNPPADRRVNHGWLGGYLALQHLWPQNEQVPVCASDCVTPEPVIDWVKRHRPDSIVCHDPHIYHFLKDAGFRIPEDFGYFSQTLAEHPPEIAGINEKAQEMGAAAINLLVGMMHRGEWGIPSSPLRLLNEGFWKDGPTMPRRNLGRG